MSAGRNVPSRIRGAIAGGDPAALAEHQAAISALQREVAELRAALERSADEQRRAVRDVVDDLVPRLDALAARLDALEA